MKVNIVVFDLEQGGATYLFSVNSWKMNCGIIYILFT